MWTCVVAVDDELFVRMIDFDCCCKQHKNTESSFLSHRSDNYDPHSHYCWNYADWETIVFWRLVKMAHVVLVQHKPKSKIGRMLAWLKVLVSAQFWTDFGNFIERCKFKTTTNTASSRTSTAATK